VTQWRTARLEDVAQVLGGGTPSRTEPSYFGGATAWATPTDITKLDQLYINQTKETVSEEGLRNSSTKLMPPGAVLLTSRATIGFTAISTVPICTNQGFINFICGPELVPEYLAYWLRTQRDKMIQHAGGTTFKEIARGTLRKFEIPFPPLPEQRRIVDLLSRAEGIVRLRREAEKKAAELIPALFLDRLGDPATNPKRWPVQPLKNLVSFVSGGTPAKSRDDYWQGDLPWVSPKDMKRVGIDSAIDQINRKILSETSIKLIPPGAILVVVRGMILVHTVPIAQSLVPLTINQDMKALIPVESLNVTYLLWSLRVRQGQLLSLVSTAAHGTKKLETARLEEFQVPLPPLEEQKRFADRLASVEAIQVQQSTATAKAQAAFDALLAKCFDQGAQTCPT
jgi:type I restriction enzyme S subunit